MPRYERQGFLRTFWEITRDRAVLTLRSGRVGGKVTEKTLTFGSEEEAKRECAGLIQGKTHEGYRHIPEPADLTVRINPELDAAILRSPDDEANYLVYGDWLQAQGDPRGELIALQHAASIGGNSEEARALRERIDDHIVTHGELLLGDNRYGTWEHAARAPPGRRRNAYLGLTWKLGFIHHAKVGGSYDQSVNLPAVVEQLLIHPSARFIRSLALGLKSGETSNDYGATIAMVAKRAPRTLAKLYIGQFDIPEECTFSQTFIEDVTPLYTALPDLRTLWIQGSDIRLGDLRLPGLRELHLRSAGLPRATLRTVLDANLPELERLELWLGAREHGGDCTLDDLQPLLDGERFPNLKHLGLCNTELSDALCEVLPETRVLRQLESLDLSKGTMTRRGAEAMARHTAAFAHLRRLDVSENLLSDADVESLEPLYPAVWTQEQRYSDDTADPVPRQVASHE